MTTTRDLIEGTTTYRRFDPPRGVYEYGFDKDGAIRDDESPSGTLLPYSALDAHATAVVRGEPCEYVVRGEWVRDGRRWPDLAVNPRFMELLGFVFQDRKWVRP